MAITAANIESALRSVGALGGQMRSTAELAAGANTALSQAPSGLTPAGAAAFLATMMQESAYWRTTQEYTAGRNRYSPYDGRTFEMITWRDNYAKFGAWLHSKGLISNPNQFVNNPKSLADYRWAWLGGVWFFAANNLWSYANTGDFLAVSRGVNLGNPRSSATPNGWSERKKAYDALRPLGDKLLPKPTDKNSDATPSGKRVKTITEHVPIYPTAGSIQTPFGKWGKYWSWNRRNGQGQHGGDDWHRGAGSAEKGDKIVAVADGTVIYAGSGGGWDSAFGNHVLITWAKKIKGETSHRTSIDAHMTHVAVKSGQKVKAGDVIGYKGMTGNVTGVHDHHEQHTGPHWTSGRVKPVYPGTTITKTVQAEGVPIMAKPKKLRRTKPQKLKKRKTFHSILLNNSKTYTAASLGATGGTFDIRCNINTDHDTWARVILVNYKKGQKTKVHHRYDRVKIKAGGDQITMYDHTAAPPKGWQRKVRVQVLAYSRDITVRSSFTRTGIEKD